MFGQVIFLKGTHLYISKNAEILSCYHETQVSYIYSAGLCKYVIVERAHTFSTICQCICIFEHVPLA